jgi:hypothetical protein
MPEPSPQTGPLVSVLVPTFNRRRYLPEALRSILAQTYPHFEAVVVNDGGEPVRDIVESLNDPRIVLVERRENRGKAASLNEALGRARGKYVAYLDDDDRYYPAHLGCLVDALETHADCQAAYTDLYKVHCRVAPDGSRQVLGKIVNVSRDFDRFFICYFNHVLHVSLAHRRDLLEKTGPYNEAQRVLIDWDMTRRLAFFTDFHHVAEVTGEYFGPVGPCDRISYRMRLDPLRYLEQVAAIRTRRPAKPWPKMPDLSIILLPDALDAAVGVLVRDIWLWTFMPYLAYLPMPAAELARLNTEMPGLVRVPTPDGAPRGVRLDEALRRAEGDYVAVVPAGVQPESLWIEDPLHAAMACGQDDTAFAISSLSPGAPPWAAAGDWPAVVLRRDALRRAREGRTRLSLRASLAAAGIAVRPPAPEERALRFDRFLADAEAMQREGNWVQAAARYGRIRSRWANQRWMEEREAWALFRAGTRDARAMELASGFNRGRPTVSTLLVEAKLLRRLGRTEEAAVLLERAEQILSWKV